MNRILLPLLLLLLAGCASVPIPKTMADIPAYDTRAAEWFLSTRIKYWRDYSPEDSWRPCAKTLKLGYGDCEDYALCAMEVMKDWPGCDPRIVVYHPEWAKGRAHAVTFVKCDNGLYGYFQNGLWVRNSIPRNEEDLGYELSK